MVFPPRLLPTPTAAVVSPPFPAVPTPPPHVADPNLGPPLIPRPDTGHWEAVNALKVKERVLESAREGDDHRGQKRRRAELVERQGNGLPYAEGCEWSACIALILRSVLTLLLAKIPRAATLPTPSSRASLSPARTSFRTSGASSYGTHSIHYSLATTATGAFLCFASLTRPLTSARAAKSISTSFTRIKKPSPRRI